MPAQNAMLAAPPGAYPLRGLAYLCSHPRLNARVGTFLAGVSALCIAGILTLALLTFRSQLQLIGHSFIGTGIAGKVITGLLILAEATLVVYLIFKQTMQVLQKRLFLDVLHGTAPLLYTTCKKSNHKHVPHTATLQLLHPALVHESLLL